MELAEVTRRVKTDQERAKRKRDNVAGRSQIKHAHAHNEKIGDHRVEETPQNVHRG
jgi:hypothetical protein